MIYNYRNGGLKVLAVAASRHTGYCYCRHKRVNRNYVRQLHSRIPEKIIYVFQKKFSLSVPFRFIQKSRKYLTKIALRNKTDIYF